ncbi:MAG: DUF4293 domain-containing protein [Saprospiraceae bacterium]
MIQRIQTIFLLLASACAFGLFALPFASSAVTPQAESIFADGIYNIHDNMALLVLYCAAGAMAFIGIFLYNNRKSQLLINRFGIIANVLGLVLTLWLVFQDGSISGDAEVQEQLGIGLPILFLVFAILAQRYINKDQKLVSSMDRLR